MKRKLTIIMLLAGLLACEQEKILPVDTNQPKPDQSNHDREQTHLVFERSTQQTVRGVLSGPEFRTGGKSESGAPKLGVAVPFEANAGAIWKDPANNVTHLFALQLPSGNGPLLEADLGGGWEGTTALTMDAANFYAVNGSNIYKVDKSKFDTWEMIVPSNGKQIKFIVGDQDFRPGFFFVRNGIANYYNGTEGFVTQLLKHPTLNLENATCMSGFRNGASGFYLYFSFTSGHSSELWRLSISSTFAQSWSKLPDFNANVFNQSMIGDPEQYRLYESGLNQTNSLQFRLNIVNPNTGIELVIGVFSYLRDNPWPVEDGPEIPIFISGQLAVNNSWLWMLGRDYLNQNTFSLYKVITLGSKTGEITSEYTSFNGTSLICAYPQLHFN